MDNKILILLGMIVFTSGCLHATLGFDGLFGNTGGADTTAQNDILLVRDVQIIPSGSIPADSNFEVSFQVQNTGGAETGKIAENVSIIGFDWGTCTPQDTDLLDGSTLKGVSDQPVNIFPGGGTELVEWTFRSPTNRELGGVSGICPIRFKVSYDFDAFTVSSFVVVGEERLSELNRAGQTANVAGSQSKSEGPIKVDVSIDSPQPIRSGTRVPLRIVVEDRGQGLYTGVPTGDLKITFPSALEGSSIVCDDRMSTSGLERTNDEEIQMIRGRSPPIRCDITAPEVEDLRTLTIQAEIEYTYTLFDQVDASIRPTFESLSSTSSSSTGTDPSDEDI